MRYFIAMVVMLYGFMTSALPVTAEPPPKGTQKFIFGDVYSPTGRNIFCEAFEDLEHIARAVDASAALEHYSIRKRGPDKSICFALVFAAEVLADPILLSSCGGNGYLLKCWAVPVQFGNMSGFALYIEAVRDHNGRPVQVRST